MYDSTYRGARLWVGELIADHTAKRKFGKPRETSEIQDISRPKTKRSSDVKCMKIIKAKSLSKLSEDQRSLESSESSESSGVSESPVEVLDSLD